VARHGWRLLPHYRFDPAVGHWQHVAGQAEAPLTLRDVRYTSEGLDVRPHRHREPEARLADYLAEARALLAAPPRPGVPPQSSADLAVGRDFEVLRWFLMPDEAAAELAAEGAVTRSPAESPGTPGYETGQ
jgi:hypothetical protein